MSTATLDAPAHAAPEPAVNPAMLAAWAVGGPALMGLVFSLTFSPGKGLAGPEAGFVLSWPMAIVGVTLLCAPTLYIAAAFAGVAPDPQRTARGFAETLGSVGRLLVGCLPATAFLAATNPGPLVILLSGFVMCGSALIFLRGLFRRVFADDARPRTRLVFACWSMIFMAIGLYAFARLFITH